ncbi:hypothetical protein RchiOBHm_Chr1g0326321 [Rosa chinensis]|uniref:Uncharacterized protein n=1 Tax=Rosa chinensis TaxID=74649 RepID=A0A2P6SA97_ROSCH|nr:hypothetical protein RchiOBHm_Chr1g0326321 [Rosa chinensis]
MMSPNLYLWRKEEKMLQQMYKEMICLLEEIGQEVLQLRRERRVLNVGCLLRKFLWVRI